MSKIQNRFKIVKAEVRDSGAQHKDKACADITITDSLSGLSFGIMLRGYMTEDYVELECFTVDADPEYDSKTIFRGSVRTYSLA